MTLKKFFDRTDIVELLKYGPSRELLYAGMRITELKRKFGEPSSTFGDSKSGYLYYDFLRVGYFEDQIDEFAIIFEGNADVEFPVPSQQSFGEAIILSYETTLHQFIHLLNHIRIPWRSQYLNHRFDYISIALESQVEISFELIKGYLTRISLPNEM